MEWAKKKMGIAQATGDLFVLPLCLGIAIGRMGCFLTGLSDDTYGLPSVLPWAVDFGDGIPRHPAQLYEIAFAILLGLDLAWRRLHPHQQGSLFKLFMVCYAAFRLAVDFIKPGIAWLGLTAIQWVCVMILAYYLKDLPSLFSSPHQGASHAS